MFRMLKVRIFSIYQRLEVYEIFIHTYDIFMIYL